MDTMRWKLTGIAPLILHNGRLANPFDPFARAIKEITAKRKKTDEDAFMLYWLEWVGGLYAPFGIGPDRAADHVLGVPVMPESNILSFLNDGARHTKQGQDVWRAIVMTGGDAPIQGTGWPEKKTLRQVYDTGQFNDVRIVVMPTGGGRVMRSRPIFRQWWLEFELVFDEEMLSRTDIARFIDRAARYNGIGDGKPLFGRCTAEEIAAVGTAAA